MSKEFYNTPPLCAGWAQSGVRQGGFAPAWGIARVHSQCPFAKPHPLGRRPCAALVPSLLPPIEVHGTPWIDMHGIPWTGGRDRKHEFSCLHLPADSNGISWNSWIPYKSKIRWTSIDFHEIRWESMEFLAIRWNPWNFMDARNFMECHGFPLASMVLHGVPWNSMEFH